MSKANATTVEQELNDPELWRIGLQTELNRGRRTLLARLTRRDGSAVLPLMAKLRFTLRVDEMPTPMEALAEGPSIALVGTLHNDGGQRILEVSVNGVRLRGTPFDLKVNVELDCLPPRRVPICVEKEMRLMNAPIDDVATAEELALAAADATRLRWPVLLCAARLGHDRAAAHLLANGARVEERNDRRETALHAAAYYGHWRIVRRLLDQHADPNVLDREGKAPLHWAVRHCDYEISALLIERGAKANLNNKRCGVPMHYAAANNFEDLARLLMAHGADGRRELTQRNVSGNTPLHLCSFCDSKEVAALIIARGAVVDALNEFDETPLMYAAQLHAKGVVGVLLANAAAVDRADKWGRTALHFAAMGGCVDEAILLLAAGAQLDVKDTCGRTPLKTAVELGRREVVLVLENRGLDSVCKKDDCSTPVAPRCSLDAGKSSKDYVYDTSAAAPASASVACNNSASVSSSSATSSTASSSSSSITKPAPTDLVVPLLPPLYVTPPALHGFTGGTTRSLRLRDASDDEGDATPLLLALPGVPREAPGSLCIDDFEDAEDDAAEECDANHGSASSGKRRRAKRGRRHRFVDALAI